MSVGSEQAPVRKPSFLTRLLLPESAEPLRVVAKTSGWYPLVILTTFNVVDELDRAALSIFAPNIQRYFGINDTVLGLVVGVQFAFAIIAAVPLGYLATKMNRARLLRWSAAAWGTFSTLTSLAIKLPLFIVMRAGSGIGKGAVEPVGKAFLADAYPPTAWNRVFAIHNAANPLGGIIGPLMAGAIGFFVAGDAAWRIAFPILTIPTVVALIASARLHETENQMAKQVLGATMTATGAPVGQGFVPSVRQLLAIATFRRQIVGVGVLGFGLVGVLAFGSLFFERVHGLGVQQRGVVFGILGFASLFGTLVGGTVGEHVFQASPRRSIYLVGIGITAFSVIISSAVYIPSLPIVVAVLFIAIVAVSIAAAPLYAVLSAITPAQLRPLMFSLLGLCIALFGGVLGGAIVGSLAEWRGIQFGLASLAPFGIIGGLLMARGASTVEADIAAASGAVAP